ncbi:MAG TPA: hypothetical protein PL143_18360 [Rhodocyclaceae bacterium]|jgi:DNA-binding response OmpR family regulator|nr:hypothetical protein [Rhodocyclaceae bacterium]
MQTMIRALFVSCDRQARRRLDETVWSAGGVTVLWSHCEPGDFDGLADAARHDLVVVDGARLGARVVEAVQRIRWLGFAEPLVVVGFGRSELERVLAFEAGADAVHAEQATFEIVTARLHRPTCDGRYDGRYDALAKAWSAGGRTYAP